MYSFGLPKFGCGLKNWMWSGECLEGWRTLTTSEAGFVQLRGEKAWAGAECLLTVFQ